MPTKPQSVAEYLAALPPDRRSRFEELRATVRAAAPGTTEVIAYDMPAYRLDGRFMCSIGAYAKHDSLFPASQVVLDRLGDDVRPYVKGRGTFQFPLKAPLPLELIDRIVRTRLEETAAALDAKR